MSHITKEQEIEAYEAMVKIEKEIADHNAKILEEIAEKYGDTVQNDLNDLLDYCTLDGEINIVKEAYGDDQNEECGIFKQVIVDQWATGTEGDSFAGRIYGKIDDNLYLEIPFEC